MRQHAQVDGGGGLAWNRLLYNEERVGISECVQIFKIRALKFKRALIFIGIRIYLTFQYSLNTKIIRKYQRIIQIYQIEGFEHYTNS